MPMNLVIQERRKELGLTQEQVAEYLNVSIPAVSKWENGKAVPEVSILCRLSELFHCSIDSILDPPAWSLCEMDFDYEFLVKPRVPIADYSGPEWPKSISIASLLTALKLFFGLEQRRDSKNRQINDDEEYILQSAMTNVCFGYSYAPDEWPRDCFLIYGLDYDIHSQAGCPEDAFIARARGKIEHGYPVILIPKEYTDTIFAAGFSSQGKVMKTS